MTNIKINDLNVKSDVYATSSVPNIPCQIYKYMISVITKIFIIEGTYNVQGT